MMLTNPIIVTKSTGSHSRRRSYKSLLLISHANHVEQRYIMNIFTDFNASLVWKLSRSECYDLLYYNYKASYRLWSVNTLDLHIRNRKTRNIMLCHSCAKPSSESFFHLIIIWKKEWTNSWNSRRDLSVKYQNLFIYHCNTLIDYIVCYPYYNITYVICYVDDWKVSIYI